MLTSGILLQNKILIYKFVVCSHMVYKEVDIQEWYCQQKGFYLFLKRGGQS